VLQVCCIQPACWAETGEPKPAFKEKERKKKPPLVVSDQSLTTQSDLPEHSEMCTPANFGKSVTSPVSLNTLLVRGASIPPKDAVAGEISTVVLHWRWVFDSDCIKERVL